MNRTELRNAYKSFFVESEAGKHCLNTIKEMMGENVERAINKADMIPLNKAAGNKDVIDHIESVLAETKKGSLPRE